MPRKSATNTNELNDVAHDLTERWQYRTASIGLDTALSLYIHSCGVAATIDRLEAEAAFLKEFA